jgi:pimeloyl-ACP methyl ester carboxylesterase
MNSRVADPVILIHGAWQGAWVWDRLVPLLASAGVKSIAVDLPGNGTDDTKPADVSLDLYVDHIGKLIEPLPQRVSLVGHSGGGVIASAVAERFPERVSRIAYVAGMMLPDGVGYADIVAQLKDDHPNVAGIAPHLVWSPDRLTSRVPVEAAITYYFHDCSPADAMAAAQRLTPQPERGRAVKPRLTPERFGRVPRLYIEAENDRSIFLACQRRMQALVPGAEVVTLPTGHAPQLAAPGLLADVLRPFLAAPDLSAKHSSQR